MYNVECPYYLPTMSFHNLFVFRLNTHRIQRKYSSYSTLKRSAFNLKELNDRPASFALIHAFAPFFYEHMFVGR